MSQSQTDTPAGRMLIVLDGALAICRLNLNSPVPSWASLGSFSSITRTPDELCIVCAQEAVPEDIRCERGWRCLRVVGTIDFSEVGVLASLTTPLAEAGISVFAVSTFDTDYLLIRTENLQQAIDVLRQAGHSISQAMP